MTNTLWGYILNKGYPHGVYECFILKLLRVSYKTFLNDIHGEHISEKGKETEAEKATVKEAEAEKTAAKEAEAKKTAAKGKETEKEAEKVTGMGSRAEETCCCHQKAVPRQEKEVKQLKNRLNRIMGQLNGIGRMLEENRYCGDILTQVAAVESALQSFGYLILQEHMKSCVVDEIRNGNTAIVEEAVELMKKLK